MAFRNGLEISVDRPGRCYYQIETMELPANGGAGDPAPAALAPPSSLERIRGILARCGNGDPAPPAGPGTRSVGDTGKPFGARGSLVEISGAAGRIDRITIDLRGAPADVDLRGLFLRVWVDGAANPAVDAPLDLLCCTPFALRDTAALPLLVRGETLSLYFRMPFSTGIRIALAPVPSGRVASPEGALSMDWTPGDPGTPLRFHARYRRDTTAAGRPFTILEETGRGHFVGVSMAMVGNDGIWFLEGDEEVWVDGEKVFNGTGTEDYFNSGWYFSRGPVQQPFHGCTVKEDLLSRIGVHRFHVSDAIPFERSFRMTMEHGGRNDYPGAGYAAVAFAYLDRAEGAKPLAADEDPRPLVDSPLPAGALDAKALLGRIVSGRGEVRPHPDGAVLRPFLDFEEGEKPEIAALSVDVAEAGIYRLWAAYRLGLSCPVEARLGGRPIGRWTEQGAKDLWKSEPFSAAAGAVELALARAPGEPWGDRRSGLGLRGLRFQNLLEGESHLPIPAERVRDGLAVEQAISWDPARKGTAQIWFRSARVGSSFAIEVPIPDPGRYRIGGRFTRAPDYGIFRLLVDGEPQGEPWDGYAPRVGVAEGSFGERALAAGVRRFTFEVVGRNEAARNDWMIGLDRLFLERLGD